MSQPIVIRLDDGDGLTTNRLEGEEDNSGYRFTLQNLSDSVRFRNVRLNFFLLDGDRTPGSTPSGIRVTPGDGGQPIEVLNPKQVIQRQVRLDTDRASGGAYTLRVSVVPDVSEIVGSPFTGDLPFIVFDT